MSDTNSNSTTPTNGEQSNEVESSHRKIDPRKIGLMRRQMDGAEKRMLSLENRLKVCRSIIRRKIKDHKEKDGKVTHVRLTPTQVRGCRLERIQIERDLAVAKGDYMMARRAYRDAVSRNFQVEMDAVKIINEENRIRREATKLMKITRSALELHGNNGGAAEYKRLMTLALDDDVMGFRKAFDEILRQLDGAHFEKISTISQVKTEIIHSIMDQMVDKARKEAGSVR